MNILKFNGGLGNQMFQYAFYLSQKEKQSGLWLFDVSDSRYHHQGFELDRLFGWCKHKRLHRKILGLIKMLGLKSEIYKEQDGVHYHSLPKVSRRGSIVEYIGFWQSEKYFEEVKNEVRRAFQFDSAMLNAKSSALIEQIENCDVNYVSVHIRRGDYLLDSERQVCTLDYYSRAMEYMKEQVEKPSFVIFSDDIKWCKEQFGEANERMQYVDWNYGADSWQDMCLMSKCSHHIIANSSFSWWGAWLNDKQDKIVICPKRWNVDFPLDTDTIPQDGVRL